MPSLPERRISILCDNATAHPDCGAEWGLSMAVDLGAGQGLWLWDTGQTDVFLRNAKALGVDAAKANGLALSHGHYDHTGGLGALARAGFCGRVVAHPSCAKARYAFEGEERPRKAVGVPAALPEFTAAGPVTELAPGLTLLADIPRAPGRFQSVAGFSYDTAGHEPDPVPDDAFLVLETAQGPVAVLGCCHSGLANSLAAATERLGITAFHAVLGGLHLYNTGEKALAETAETLRAYGIRQLVAGHCTGADRVCTLARLLPACCVRPLAAGQTWTY